MGRGRQKAKNTKVARELKYYSPSTDYSALQAELSHKSDSEPDYEDKWADLYEDDEEEESSAADSTKVEAEKD